MPTWAEIQQHARSTYKLQQDEENFFSLVFSFDGGRTHKIWVRKFAAMETEWLEFRAIVCKFTEMAPKVALRKNADLIIGSLALDADDDYILVHNAPLDSMDLSEFERPLHVIAGTADNLEKAHAEDNDKW